MAASYDKAYDITSMLTPRVGTAWCGLFLSMLVKLRVIFIHIHVYEMSILSGATVQKHNVDVVK